MKHVKCTYCRYGDICDHSLFGRKWGKWALKLLSFGLLWASRQK